MLWAAAIFALGILWTSFDVVFAAALWVVGYGVFQVMARRDEGRNRVVLDAHGIAARRGREVVAFTEWERVAAVRFRSGSRWPTLTGVTFHHEPPSVGWSDDAPPTRWEPHPVAGRVDLVAVGRRRVEDLERSVRAACEAHGVPYVAHWSWGWRLRLRRRPRMNRSE